MPRTFSQRLELLLDSPDDRKHLPLLTNDEVYSIIQQQASQIKKLKEENEQLKRKIEIIRGNSIMPPREWKDPKTGSTGIEVEK